MSAAQAARTMEAQPPRKLAIADRYLHQNAKAAVHDVYDALVELITNADDGYVVSVRWSALGSHRGFGPYGQPTGKEVHIWGINQWVIEDGVVQKEWMLFNEFGVLLQLCR